MLQYNTIVIVVLLLLVLSASDFPLPWLFPFIHPVYIQAMISAFLGLYTIVMNPKRIGLKGYQKAVYNKCRIALCVLFILSIVYSINTIQSTSTTLRSFRGQLTYMILYTYVFIFIAYYSHRFYIYRKTIYKILLAYIYLYYIYANIFY